MEVICDLKVSYCKTHLGFRIFQSRDAEVWISLRTSKFTLIIFADLCLNEKGTHCVSLYHFAIRKNTKRIQNTMCIVQLSTGSVLENMCSTRVRMKLKCRISSQTRTVPCTKPPLLLT